MNKYKELIKQLHYFDETSISENCGNSHLSCTDLCKDSDCIVIQAIDAIETLMKELEEERYRHDRLVDFELAQSKELEKYKNAYGTLS